MKTILSYNDFLSAEKALTVEEMHILHEKIIEEIGSDEDALELYEELMKTAIRYSGIRANWPLLSKKEKMEQDDSRTSCHNSVIIKFNQLARYLKMQGKSALWRDELGYEEEDKINRKKIGDFACYLVFVSGVNAR